MKINRYNVRKNKLKLLIVLFLFISLAGGAGVRTFMEKRKQSFDNNWKFRTGDDPQAMSITFKDAS